MTASGVAAILGSCGLFDGLTEKQLAAVAEEAHTKRFAKGETLFREGDEADSFLILTEGSVKVFVTSDRGHESEA
jgi:CRP/FNR family transcriptional regulator